MKKIILLTCFVFITAAGICQELEASIIYTKDKLIDTDHVSVSSIYPNPAVHSASLDFLIQDPDAKVYITFRNILGSEVGQFKLTPLENSLTISLEKLTSGVYFYTLRVNDKSVITKKFIVNR